MADTAIKRGFVDVPHGQMHYRYAGDSGEPLLILHASPGSSRQQVRLIEDFASGAHAFSLEDFRASYSPAQWSELRQRLAEAGFRGARVHMQVQLSDQMRQFLGASSARAEVPNVILE